MNLSIELPLSDISRKINAVLKPILYEGDVKKPLDVHIKITKRELIHVYAMKSALVIKAPIRAEGKLAQKSLLAWIPGFSQKIEDFDVDISVFFEIIPTIEKNWKLNPTIQARYVWDTEPNLSIIGVPLPIQTIMEVVLDGQIPLIQAKILDFLVNELQIEQYVKLGWDLIQSPILIHDETQTSVSFIPETHPVFATPIHFNPEGNLSAILSVPMNISVKVGESPDKNPLLILPNFEPNPSLTQENHIPIAASISYDFITRFLQGKKFSLKGHLKQIEILALTCKPSQEALGITASLRLVISWWGISIPISFIASGYLTLTPQAERGIQVNIENLTLDKANFWVRFFFSYNKEALLKRLIQVAQGLADEYWGKLREILTLALNRRALGNYVILHADNPELVILDILFTEKEIQASVIDDCAVHLRICNF